VRTGAVEIWGSLFSKAYPLLEEIDFETAYGVSVGVRPFGSEMENFPTIFPNLKKVSLEILRFTNKYLQHFAKEWAAVWFSST
jgi:hypothetical protein